MRPVPIRPRPLQIRCKPVLEGFQPLTRGRQTATVLGLIYVVTGIVGFAVSGFDAFAAPRGDVLMILTVNPLQNLIHLVMGSWLVNAAQQGEDRSRSAGLKAVTFLAVLGAAGLVVGSRAPELNYLNANLAVNLSHLLSAAAAFIALGKRS